jgi:FkbM family methyltransferase
MSFLVRAYQAAVPECVRGPLWHLRAWAGAMAAGPAARRAWLARAADPAARRDWLAQGLAAAGRPLRAVRVPHGRLWVDLRDVGVGRKIFVHRRYEEAEARALREFLRPGMGYLDVGGNLGYLATLAARLVGPSGRVVAVEPEPYNFSLLRRNLRLNAPGRAVAVNAAAGAAPGTARLFKAAENLGDHRLYADGEAGRREGVDVPVVRLDELYAANGWPAPDFVKIDVQGYEPFVAAGLEGLVTADRPRAVLTEYWPLGIRNAGGDPAAYLEWFRARGFACRLVGDGGAAPVGYGEIDARLPPLDPGHPDAQMLNLVFHR